MNYRWMLLWSSALGASGVAAGAFGAHGLKNPEFKSEVRHSPI